MKKIIILILLVVLSSCNSEDKTMINNNIDTFAKCVEQKGEIIDNNPKECVYNGVVFLENENVEEIETKKDDINNYKLDDMNLEISYPKEWGDVKINKNIYNNILFTNKPTIDLSAIDYKGVIDWNDNFVGGGEAVKFDLEYLDYMRSKLSSFDNECKKIILGFANCIDLKMSEIGNKKILSYIGLMSYGEIIMYKEWLYFVDDKLIKLYVDLKDIIDDENLDNLDNLLNNKKNNIIYDDLNLDKNKMNDIDKFVNDIFSSVDFQSTNTKEDITKNIDNLKKYIKDLEISNTSSDSNVLSELSKSDFIQVRSNVANNKNTPIEILIELSNDPSDIVKNSLKFNKNTPKEISEKIEDLF